jgi:hypothetical protein
LVVGPYKLSSEEPAECETLSTLERDDEGALIDGYWMNTPLSTTGCISERGLLSEDDVAEREWLLTLGRVEFDLTEGTW